MTTHKSSEVTMVTPSSSIALRNIMFDISSCRTELVTLFLKLRSFVATNWPNMSYSSSSFACLPSVSFMLVAMLDAISISRSSALRVDAFLLFARDVVDGGIGVKSLMASSSSSAAILSSTAPNSPPLSLFATGY